MQPTSGRATKDLKSSRTCNHTLSLQITLLYCTKPAQIVQISNFNNSAEKNSTVRQNDYDNLIQQAH